MTPSAGAAGLLNRVMRSRRLRRFAVVGVTNTATDALVFFALVQATGLIVASNVAAYGCGAAVSYLLNRYWTFSDIATGGSTHGQIVRFVLLNLTTLAVSTTALVLANAVLPLWAAKAVAILIAASLSFLGMRFIVFRR